MLTNIIEESTLLLSCGPEAERIAEEAFGEKANEGALFLPNVVSRKKQVVPKITVQLQQEK